MSPRIKKLIGTILTLVWLFVYALLVAKVAVAVLPTAGGFVTFLFYLFAGTLWTIPIGLMIPWMQREPKPKKR